MALISIGVSLSAGAAPGSADPFSSIVQPGLGFVEAPSTGTADLDVPVSLSVSSANPVTVQWTTLDVPGAPLSEWGPQAQPTDYVASSGAVTFEPDETTAHVSIPVTGGRDLTGEYVVVSFHDPTNAQMGGFWGLGFGVITPVGYGPVPTVTYAFPPSWPVPAGGGTFTTTLNLDQPTNHVVTVRWSTAELGSYYDVSPSLTVQIQPAPASDYDATSGTATFQPGETSQSVAVTVHSCACPQIIAPMILPTPFDHGEVLWLTESEASGALIGPYFTPSSGAQLLGQPSILYPG